MYMQKYENCSAEKYKCAFSYSLQVDVFCGRAFSVRWRGYDFQSSTIQQAATEMVKCIVYLQHE